MKKIKRLIFADFGSYYPTILDVFLRHIDNTLNPKAYHDLLSARIDNKKKISELNLDYASYKRIEKALDIENDEVLFEELTGYEVKYITYNGKITGVKLILNKAFGVMGSPTNPLFHPIKLSTVTVIGQILITELIFRVRDRCSSDTILGQANTDGVLFESDNDDDIKTIEEICLEYSKEINISIDVEYYTKIIQSTVNNYILIDDNGKFKLKGSATKNYYGTQNLEQASRLTNSLSIRSKALVDYFVYNIPVEQTVRDCKDPTRFQYIASSNSKTVGYYNKTTNRWELKNNRIMVLKDSTDKIVKITKGNVNKVVNVGDEDDQTLNERFREVYEAKKQDISVISLPQHDCCVTNVLEITDDIIDRIDHDFYIDLCKDHINKFTNGIEIKDDEEEEII